MDLANKTFRNNKTGETIKVIDSFEDIAILENKQKINVRQLMDSNQFTEQIDPGSFFNTQGAYNILADKIKNIPTNSMVDEDGGVVVNFGDDSFKPAMNESAIIMSNEDDERAELMRKYGAVPDSQNESAKQAAAFDKILNPDAETPVETYTPPVSQPVVNNMPGHSNPPVPPVQRVEVEDPVVTMFKKTKRNVNFSVSIELSDRIPRLDFIEMMEDSYEISIIDFLADEFTNKVLQDPSVIRNSIKDKIKQLVYGGTITKVPVQEDVFTKEEKTDSESEVVEDVKLSATERSKYVMGLKSIKDVEEYLKDEKAKSVKEAGKKRIEQLKK